MSQNKKLEQLLQNDQSLSDLFFLISQKSNIDKTKLLEEFSNKLLEMVANNG